ncbi:hypothetical protein [Sphingomonas sp. TZW2008]|uniref:hypothetical protein n=1 Tax=Sphingomonas sp. TZW2008 TaxID=1917973 RepID=UPI000A2678EB|nr:hypothetical protein [Sphingomonas sp. TZW2008]
MRMADLLVQAPLFAALQMLSPVNATVGSPATGVCHADSTGTVFRCAPARARIRRGASLTWSNATAQIRSARIASAGGKRLAADSPETLEAILAARIGSRATQKKETK